VTDLQARPPDVLGPVALLFPGQGAQSIGMGQSAWTRSAAARAIFAQADDVLGYALSTLCFEGPDDVLRQTDKQQPAILACSLAILAAHDEVHGPFEVVAATGHSLGLYSALVAAGVLDLDVALPLVATRGALMQKGAEARCGGMVAVLGLDDAIVEAVCAEASAAASSHDPVVAANYNAPGQVVISGGDAALEKAIPLLKERGARKVVALAVAGAFHSPLMEGAAQELAPLLQEAPLREPSYPVYANSRPEAMIGAAEMRAELLRQVLAPVRWSHAVSVLAATGAVSAYVDCGPTATLTALQKRITPGATIVTLDGRGA